MTRPQYQQSHVPAKAIVASQQVRVDQDRYGSWPRDNARFCAARVTKSHPGRLAGTAEAPQLPVSLLRGSFLCRVPADAWCQELARAASSRLTSVAYRCEANFRTSWRPAAGSEAQPRAQAGLGCCAYAGHLRGVTRRHHRACFAGRVHWPLPHATLPSERIFKSVCREEHGGIVGQSFAEGCNRPAIGSLSRRRKCADHCRHHQAEFHGLHCPLQKKNLSRTLVECMALAKERIVVSRIHSQSLFAEEALQRLREIMRKLKLTVNEEKTQICRVPEGEFDFLGHTFGRMYSAKTGKAYIGYRPSKKSIKRMVENVHALTVRSHSTRVGELLRSRNRHQGVSGDRQLHGCAVTSVVALQAQGQAKEGRDLSTLAPLRALRARTPVPAWAPRAVGEGVRSCPRAGCGRSTSPGSMSGRWKRSHG